MKVNEWLREKSRRQRILITQDLSYGRDLIASAGTPVFGTKCMTIEQIARSIVSLAYAEKGMHSVRYINNQYASALLRTVLLDHMDEFSYYRNPALLDQAGADEIYRIMCIVRNSLCVNKEEHLKDIPVHDHERINDLFHMTALFEEALKQNNVLDPCGILHEAAEEIQYRKTDDLFFAETAVLSSEEKYFSFDERQLVEGIARLCNPERVLNVLDLPEYFEDYLKGIRPEHTEITFGRGFGYANEVKHIIYDILHNNHPFGDTCILYASSAMEPWFVSELEAAGISFTFHDGRSMTGNSIVCLFRALLKWASRGFFLNDFSDVLANSRLSFHYPWEGEERVWHASSLMRMMADGRAGRNRNFMIGWGYERYVRYLDLYRQSLLTDEMNEEQRMCRIHAADLLESLLDLFRPEGLSCGSLVKRMLQWMEEAVPASSMDRKELLGPLADLAAYYAFADPVMSDSQVYAAIDKKLSEMKVSEEDRGDAVVLRALGKPSVLRRKHIYSAGMSASNMSGNTDESPVLNDHEMAVLLDGGYLPSITAEGIRARETVLRTLASCAQGTMRISWPDYDTQDMNMRNPAVLVLDLQAIAQTEHSDGFAFGIPARGTYLSRTVPNLAVVTPASSALDESDVYSATALEEFADCPRAWYYDRVCGLGEQQLPEYHANAWLDGRSRGNFIHAVLERYIRTVFGNYRRSQYPAELQESVLSGIVSEVFNEIRDDVPEVEMWIMDREVRQINSVCASYLEFVHKDYCEKGWEFVCAEESFSGAQINAGMTYTLQGRIDRIDCMVDEERHQILLRTIDYKTGKPDNVRKKCAHGTAMQMEVYTAALQLPAIQKRIRNTLSERYGRSFEDWSLKTDLFFYVFPMAEEESILPVFAEDSFSLNRLKAMTEAVKASGTFPDRFTVGKNIEEMQGETIAPDVEKLLNAINGEPKKRGKGRKKTEENCKYCAFAKLCSAANM